jgi:glycosyltransferase involved in cell wall biosynthesis
VPEVSTGFTNGEVALPRLRAGNGRGLRLAHLTTVDMSLALLLPTELAVDVEAGLTTYGLSSPGPYVPTVETLGVTHVPLPSLTRSWNPRRDSAAGRELVAVLRSLDLDILHTHNPKTGVLGRILGRACRIPVVVNTCHGLWAGPADPLKRRLPVYGAEVAAALFSHAELYQNGTDRQTLRRWVRQGKTEVVGNGTDLSRFVPSPEDRRRVRAELGVGDGTVLAGGVGRLVEEKGIREYAEAARRLGDRAEFVWVGPDDPDKRDKLTTRLDGVRFLGERSDMPAVYNALDVFVLPSYREGFSRSAMEAAACGTAMVLSDIRGCREIGTHGEHLLLTPPRDAEALARAVEQLVDDPDLRHTLADNARRRAIATFDQRVIAVRSLRVYADVARRRGLGWTLEESA